jgi:hypothetical protein
MLLHFDAHFMESDVASCCSRASRAHGPEVTRLHGQSETQHRQFHPTSVMRRGGVLAETNTTDRRQVRHEAVVRLY